MITMKQVSKETFLEKAKSKHGDKYDYSLIDDIFTTENKLSIICPYHGIFQQNYKKHSSILGGILILTLFLHLSIR